MGRTNEELTANINDDFKTVVGQLKTFFVQGATHLQGRATHSTGIAARGQARIVTSPDFPPNEFLSFGKQYPIVVRHALPRPAIGGNTDDRTLDGAAMSVKFLMPDDKTGVGFNDILMNAGRALFVPSARAFLRLITTPNEQRQALMDAGLLDDNLLTEGYRSGLFTEFYYHSQIAFEFTDAAGTLRYLKFRAIPADRGPERGLLSASFRAEGFTFKPRWDDDARTADYRRRDFETRVRHQTVEYLLQAQLHPAGDPKVLSPMLYWEERPYPWQDVAYLRLTSILSYDEMDALDFHVNRTHDSINLPLAVTPDDTASIGNARALVYWDARQARANSPKPHIV